MNSVRMEIEAKYVVPNAGVFERLLALEALGDYRLVPKDEEHLVDRYLDTRGRALQAAGYACRVREHESGKVWTIGLKGLGGARGAVHQREEHEVDVPAGTSPPAWPESPVRQLAGRFAPVQSLEPLFVLRQHRTRRDLYREARPVALVSLDRVEMEAAPAHVGYEMEIELVPSGGIDDLHQLGKLLRPFGLRAQSRSKFERGLEFLDSTHHDAHPKERVARSAPEAPPAAPHPSGRKHPGVVADEPMAEAGRKILRFHCDRMLACEAGTRDGGDIEELHQMRVATRRQRAALRILGLHYRRKAIGPVRDGLRMLGERLGAVRDLDVLLEKTAAYHADLEPAAADALKPLVESWQARREDAREELLAHLDSHAYAVFKEAYRDFLDTPEAGVRTPRDGDGPQPSLVAHVVPAAVWEHYAAIRAFEPSLRWASVSTLHALRIEGKRLRYVLEFFREVLDPCVEQPIEAMVALQDHLGELHDADVTMELVRQFLNGPTAAAHADVAAAAGGYLEHCAAQLTLLRRGVRRPWRAVTTRRFRALLGRAVAVL